MKKTLFILIALLLASLSFEDCKAQVKKEKQTEGWYKLSDGDKIGAASISGQILIPLDYYKSIRYNKDYEKGDLFYVTYWDGSVGVFTLSGQCVIPTSRKYSRIIHFGDYYGVWRGSKEGACDLAGNEVLETIYGKVLYSGGQFHYKKNEYDLKWIATGKKLDDYGIYHGSTTSEATPSPSMNRPSNGTSEQIVDFEYMAYSTYKNGAMDEAFKMTESSLDQYIVRFDLKTVPGKIVVKLLSVARNDGNKETQLETYTIDPSQTNFDNEGSNIRLLFMSGNQLHVIAFGDLEDTHSYVFLGNVSSEGEITYGKRFRPMSAFLGASSRYTELVEHVDMLNVLLEENAKICLEPTDFKAKFSNLKAALSKYNWGQ